MADAVVIGLAVLGVAAWAFAASNYRRARASLFMMRACRQEVLEADRRLDAKRRELRALEDRRAAVRSLIIDAEGIRWKERAR